MYRKVILVGLSITFLDFAAASKNDHPIRYYSRPAVCKTAACYERASALLSDMDPSFHPCDNFYRFACGNFVKNRVIPENDASYSQQKIISSQVRRKLKSKLSEPIAREDPKAFKILKLYYKTCLEEELDDKKFPDLLNGYGGGWPVLIGKSWNESDFHATDTIAELRKLGYESNYFFHLGISVDPENHKRYILRIKPPELSRSSGSSNRLEEITSFVEKMKGGGKVDTEELIKVVNFETRVLKIESQNLSEPSKLFTLSELQKEYPPIHWRDYFEKVLFSKVNLSSVDKIQVLLPSQMKNLTRLISHTKKRVQANYAFWRFSQEVTKSRDDKTKSLEEKCLKKVKLKLPIAANIFYVKNFLSTETVKRGISMIQAMKNSFEHLINNASWLDPGTKWAAVKKVRAIVPKASFLSAYMDLKKLDDFYNDLYVDLKRKLEGFTIDGMILANSYKTVYKSEADFVERVLTYPVDLFNAIYTVEPNTIELMPGVLQGIYFDAGVPNYMNFGSLGFAIGHELTHGFHDLDSVFGQSISSRDHTEVAKENFQSGSDCVEFQYYNYRDPSTGLIMNGTITLRENIADNGGLKAAYHAYDSWRKSNGGGDEPRLPGLEAFGSRQMFWLSYANSFCVKHRAESLNELVKRKTHTLGEFRVTGSLHNRPEFARDFGCRLGSPMNPPKKCDLWRRR